MDSDSYNSDVSYQTPSTVSSNDSAIDAERDPCKICGDTAIGFNFGVRTCESCKAFFRRNAFRPHELKCAFSDDCVIIKKCRKTCPKCRIRKCFDFGMKKESILTEEQKAYKRSRRPKSGEAPMSFTSLLTGDLLQPSTSGSGYSHPSFDLDTVFKDYNAVAYEDTAELFRLVNMSAEIFDKKALRDFVSQRAIICDFKYRNQRLALETGNEWNFNQIELFKFDELRRTSVELLPKPFQYSETCASIIEGYKAIEAIITHLIKIVKQWASFRMLNIDEQIGLLKVGLVEMMFVYSICNWIPEEPTGGHYFIEERNTRIFVPTSMMLIVTTEQEHKFLQNIYSKAIKIVDNDPVIVNLIITLVLFRPRNFMERRNFLENEYECYLFILHEYLVNTTASPVDARSKFLDVLSLIEEYLTLARVFLAILDRIDPTQISHFIKEAFDISA